MLSEFVVKVGSEGKELCRRLNPRHAVGELASLSAPSHFGAVRARVLQADPPISASSQYISGSIPVDPVSVPLVRGAEGPKADVI
jgi:hypothetical protein